MDTLPANNSIASSKPTRSSLALRLFTVRAIKRIALVTILLFILLKLGFEMFEWFMVYETPLEKADVVLVRMLGGELEKAAELYHDKMVDAILITEGVPEKFRGIEQPVSLNHIIKNSLLELGIPKTAIHSLPKKPSTLLDRQLMLKEWCVNNQIQSYMVFTGYYGSGLVKMIHDDTFHDRSVKLVLYTSKSDNVVLRKHWLGIHNTLIRIVYWKLLYQPTIRNDVAQ